MLEQYNKLWWKAFFYGKKMRRGREVDGLGRRALASCSWHNYSRRRGRGAHVPMAARRWSGC
jgi:hypothetical protein